MSYREFTEQDFPKLVDCLNEMLPELLAVSREELSWNSYDPEVTSDHCEEQVSAEALTVIKSRCDEQGGYLDPLDKKKYTARARHSGDANYMSFKQWLKDREFWKQGPVFEEMNKIIVGASHSGTYWYPKNGYMGWHTNENHSGQGRFYCNYAAENDKAFFRYQPAGTDEVVTSWDINGWTFRYFDLGDKPDTRLWHCVYSNTDRISLGFRARLLKR